MILIVMGVAGSGKTTIGKMLARRLACKFYDADDFHSPANVAKMHSGVPLTDEDRAAWLDALARLIGENLANHQSMILACSALKASYRKRLQSRAPRHSNEVQFIYLRITPEVARERTAARKNHFMPPELIASQFATLEEPTDALIVDASLTPTKIVGEIQKKLPA
ncbi:MAG: gluconokinase [Acidobacteriota bacterium]